MKKKIIVAFSILCMSFFAHSQVNPNALGLRLGGGDVNGAEFSYQKGLGSENRLEFDLGFGGNKDYNRMNLGGIYHWVWNITSGLNWYVGPGAMAGLYKYKNSDGYMSIALGGQVGLEFDFNVLDAPILLSLDARPMWDFVGTNAGIGWGTSLGIRYTFK